MSNVFDTMQQTQWAADCRAAHRMRNGAGGSFAAYLADAYFAADSRNKDRLLTAFRDIFDRFATPEEMTS
jgi:hypothetical protein